MGETFCQTGGVHMAMDIVRNQINIDRELPISSKSIYRTRMSISSFGLANQITFRRTHRKKKELQHSMVLATSPRRRCGPCASRAVTHKTWSAPLCSGS